MNLADRYLLWKLVSLKRAFSVIRFDGDFLRRHRGSLAGVWPAGAFCVVRASPGAGEAILPDCLWNTDDRLFVSPRLKNSLARAAPPEVEFWPVKIIDSTGREVGEPYFLAHLLTGPDCLDLAASGAKRNRILPAMAEKVERLEFTGDPDRPLFRPSTFEKITLVGWPLAEALAKEGFTGFRFMGLFDYGIKGDLPPNPNRHKVDSLCAQLSIPR